MKSFRRKNVAGMFFGVLCLFGIQACGGGGGGTTTTAATFPSSVGVDVSDVSSEGLDAINFSFAKTGLPDGGSMTAPITTATNMADLVTKLSNHIFSGISTALNSSLTSTSTQVSGMAFGGTVKIDFTNYSYDVDGDGSNDPCSGAASISSTQYACFRAWFNDERLMIGYLQAAPSSTTSGQGVAIAAPVLVADPAAVAQVGLGTDVMAHFTWSNTAATANNFDAYSSGQVMTGVNLTVARLVASTENSKVTLGTQAFFATDKIIPIPNPPPGGGTTDVTVDQVKFNSQFITGGTHLVFEDHFYLDGTSVADQQNDTPFCGVMATGDPANPANPADVALCTADGVSLTGLEYPSLAETDASKTQFPEASVFPETPTF